jgi:hypothetical protein
VDNVTRVLWIVEVDAQVVSTSTGSTKTRELVLPIALTANVEFLGDSRLPVCTKTGSFELIAGIQTAKQRRLDREERK